MEDLKKSGEVCKLIDEAIAKDFQSKSGERGLEILSILRKSPAYAMNYTEKKLLDINLMLTQIQIIMLTMTRIQSEHLEFNNIIKK